jgi:hypothetical protein
MSKYIEDSMNEALKEINSMMRRLGALRQLCTYTKAENSLMGSTAEPLYAIRCKKCGKQMNETTDVNEATAPVECITCTLREEWLA